MQHSALLEEEIEKSIRNLNLDDDDFDRIKNKPETDYLQK